MTKALLCCTCGDIVSPYRDWRANRAWRWCQCEAAAVRWTDGDAGTLEVTAFGGPFSLRVIGFNNSFLGDAVACRTDAPAWWRELHATHAAEVPPGYLFHELSRSCWAVVIRPGQTGDVTFTDLAELADAERPGQLAPA